MHLNKKEKIGAAHCSTDFLRKRRKENEIRHLLCYELEKCIIKEKSGNLLSKYEADKNIQNKIVHFIQLLPICDIMSVKGFLVLQRRDAECPAQHANEPGAAGESRHAADFCDGQIPAEQMLAVGQTPGFQIVLGGDPQIFPKPAIHGGGADVKLLRNVLCSAQFGEPIVDIGENLL